MRPKLAGELIEIFARLVLALFQHELKRLGVLGGGGDFAGARVEDGGELGVALGRCELVEDVFAGATVLHQAGLPELAEVRGNSRLPHAEDFLDFDDRQLLLPEQKQQPEPGFVGQQAQIFHD